MAPIRRSRRLEEADSAAAAAATSTAKATAAPATSPVKKKKLAAGASAAAATRAKKSVTSTRTNIMDTPAKVKKMSIHKKKTPTTAAAATTTKTATPKKAKVSGQKTKTKAKARVTTTSAMTTTDAESESQEGSGGMYIDVVMKTENGTGGDDHTAVAKLKTKTKSKNRGKAKADDTAGALTEVENEDKPKAKRGRKPKSNSATQVAETTTTTKKPRKTRVKDKGKEVKKEDDEDGSVKPATTGSVGRKKRKVDPNVDDGGAGSGAAGTNKHTVRSYGEYGYERNVRFTKTDACGAFCLRDEDLWGLACEARANPHYRNAPPMRLYEEQEVIKKALEVHGGYIGLQAARQSTAKIRREAFKKRSEQAQTRVILKIAKKSKKDQQHDEHLQAALQMLSQDPKALAQSVAFYVDKGAQTWLKAISKDSSRAKIKAAIAEAEARVAAGEPTLLIKSTTPDRKWIDNIRNSMNGNIVKREGLKKIIENFEAGVYDNNQDNESTAATVASRSGSGSGSGSTGTTGMAEEATSSTQSTTTGMHVVVAQQQ
ncbi:hypothetical protein BGZ95_000994 [Linnemannia exigua]|uniref:XPA C-terminal domain-containing protein n=1 Tax=Linnemannia exigua TaxID=604196 RepID=A0AAD4D7G6_9FUNG|nr:hypothetical protein BGZ95_000994 [Linnemannia exigua]